MTRKTSPAYRASKEETIPIDKLHPFSNHPFHIRRDLEFSELVNSISESGIITPIIVRPKVGVGYKSYMTYNKSHVDDFLSHNRINHSEENFVLVKGDFEPIVSEKLWETCNQIRSKRAAFVKEKMAVPINLVCPFHRTNGRKLYFAIVGCDSKSKAIEYGKRSVGEPRYYFEALDMAENIDRLRRHPVLQIKIKHQ